MRQGDAVTPLLLNIVLETASTRSKVEIQGTIFDKCNQITAYADDVVITGRRLQNIEEVFTSLIKKTNKMGLEINEKKRQNL